MRQLLILSFAVILFSHCNNNKGWSAAEQQKGLKACMDQIEGKLDGDQAKKFCSCALDGAMKKWKSYAESEKAADDDPAGMEIGKNCMAAIQGGNVPEEPKKKGGGIFGGGGDDAGGGWSSADKKKFLDECTPSAVNAGVDQQAAKTYCDCTLKKIEKKYKSYNDAMKLTSEELATIQQECAAGGGNDNDN